MAAAALSSGLVAAGCAPGPGAEDTRIYGRSDVLVIDGDVIGVLAEMRGLASRSLAADYARCIAAGYAQARGMGFARHLRTTVHEQDGVWTADALYSVSPAMPDGLARIDTEVTVADCAERGVPTE